MLLLPKRQSQLVFKHLIHILLVKRLVTRAALVGPNDDRTAGGHLEHLLFWLLFWMELGYHPGLFTGHPSVLQVGVFEEVPEEGAHGVLEGELLANCAEVRQVHLLFREVGDLAEHEHVVSWINEFEQSHAFEKGLC